MYTRKILPLTSVLRWTRGHVFLFLALATVPVFLYDVVGFKWLHIPWLPLSVVGTAVAFIVGFKNNASYDRLWEGRKIWGGIVNASRSFTVMIRDFVVRGEMSEEQSRAVHRELVHRHVAWLTALRYQLRTMRPWENKRDSEGKRRFRGMTIRILESEVPIDEAIAGYISPEESREVFRKGNQASQLLGIQSRRLKELREQESLGVFEHVEMERTIAELFALQGKSERIKNFPYPRQFATLNYIFVWLFILLLPYGMMEEFEKIGDHIIADHSSADEGYGLLHSMWLFFAAHFVWFSIPFSAIVSWVFFALEVAGEHSENPFEGGPNDVPITDLSRNIEIDIRQLIDDHDIPEKLSWESGVVL